MEEARACAGPTGLEEYYRRLLDVLPDAIVLYDGEGRAVYVNDAFVALYGWTRGECYGQRLDFVPPSEKERTQDAIKRSLTGESVRMVTRRFAKDGRLVDILLITSMMKDERGKNLGIYVIHRDLTERKAVAAALEESQRLYRTLLDASPDPISVYDAGGRISYVNPAFENTFGWTLKELSGKGVDFVPPHEVESTVDAIKRTLAGEQVLLTTQRFTKSGEVLDIQIKTAIFHDSEGNLAGDIVIYRDITGLKALYKELESYKDHLEDLVRQRTEALSESRGRFRELAEMLPEIVFEIDADHRLLFANQRALFVFGLTEADLNRPFHLYSRVAPEEQERVRSNLALRLSGKGQQSIECFIQKPGGSRFPALLTSNPIVKDGRTVGLRGLAVDLSAHKSMEEQLRHAAKMEAVGTLAGGIAHDFNNILQAILGQVQLIESGRPDMEEVLKRTRQIDRAAQRAAELVRQLMSFGRKHETVHKPVDLNGEIHRVMEMLERTIPKMIQIKLDLTPHAANVLADPAQVAQIILNLATNARDAMPEGGTITIRTGLAEPDQDLGELPALLPGSYLCLTVEDNGIGMTEETRSHIFEPFFTTKGVGHGTGLGLSTVYGIVKNHRGAVRVRSEYGKGSAFEVFLPVTDLSPQEPLKEEPSLEEHKGDETILVVDDDDNVLELARAILEYQGYTIITAKSGEDALLLYNKTPKRFALVVMDLGMPGMGGRKCMESILSINPRAKILVASGYSQEREAKGILEAGAVDFVAKPYRLADLGMKVRQSLDYK